MNRFKIVPSANLLFIKLWGDIGFFLCLGILLSGLYILYLVLSVFNTVYFCNCGEWKSLYNISSSLCGKIVLGD